MTTHHTPPVGAKSARVMHKPRICKDCHTVYRYADHCGIHANARYCATCLTQHIRRCTTCRQPFHPHLDTDRLCPIHVTHPVFFGPDTP